MAIRLQVVKLIEKRNKRMEEQLRWKRRWEKDELKGQERGEITQINMEKRGKIRC